MIQSRNLLSYPLKVLASRFDLLVSHSCANHSRLLREPVGIVFLCLAACKARSLRSAAFCVGAETEERLPSNRVVPIQTGSWCRVRSCPFASLYVSSYSSRKVKLPES